MEKQYDKEVFEELEYKLKHVGKSGRNIKK